MQVDAGDRPDEEVDRAADAPVRRRRPVTVVAAVVATALVLGVAVWAWHWRTHPQLFPDDGGFMGTVLEGRRTSVYVAVTYPYPGDGERVSIAGAVPRITKNTAQARFAVYLCTLADGLGYAAIASAGPREFARACPDPVAVRSGTVLDVGADPPQQLVLGVTVGGPGVVRVEGVDLEYSHGWQSGTQTTGEHVRVVSR